MPIKIECPRCRKNLAVPGKKAGSYANCPECGGRFWVPEATPAEARLAGGASGGTSAPAVPPTDAPVAEPPREPVAPPSAPARRVARLITPSEGQSAVELSPDGKLPELLLQEDRKKPEDQAKSSSLHPLALVGLLVASVAISIFLVFWEPPAGSSDLQREQAREEIRRDYFFSPDGSLQPYQQWLREAQRAASRGDRATERRLYLQVLDALRAERPRHERGLTPNDKRLEELLAILLRE